MTGSSFDSNLPNSVAGSAPTIDLPAALRWQRIAPAASPFLHEEVAGRMVERLDWITLPIQAWAADAPVRGGIAAHQTLLQRYAKARCYRLEAQAEEGNPQTQGNTTVKKGFFQRFWGDSDLKPAEVWQLPATVSVDMVWSNMQLHSAPQPELKLEAWLDYLRPGGFALCSMLGPDTLWELREIYAELGWPSPTQRFTDMHDWGDWMLQAGFAEPVVDMERIVLEYAEPSKMLADLRELGRNLSPHRFPALRGRAWAAQLENVVSKRNKLTFEIIYAHAVKPLRSRIPVAEHSEISLDAMRAHLKKPL